jgi:fibronectin-binding autotransporter adhesin
MTISNGGQVSNSDATIGFSANLSNSYVRVTDSNSSWTNNGTLTVGSQGSGNCLTVANGGTVNATNLIIATNSGSTGTLNIGSLGGNDTAGTLVTPDIAFGSGTGTINFNQIDTATLNSSISGNGSINQLSSGTTILSGDNTYTGGTTVSSGTLRAGVASVVNTSGAFGNNSAVALANTAGVTLDLAGFDTQIGSLSGGGATGGTVTSSTEGEFTLTVGGDNTSPDAFAGVIQDGSGTMRLTKIGTGTLTLTGDNTYTGGTTIYAGTTSINNTSGSAFGTGSVTVANGATIKGTGSFIGALTLADGATFSPGNAPGLMTIGSGSVLAGITVMEIAGLSRGVTYDAVNVGGAGAITFGGTLRLILIGGFTPSAGNSFDLFDFTTGSSTFGALDLPSLASDLLWDTSALYTAGVLSVTASAIPEPSNYATIILVCAIGLAAWRKRSKWARV